MPKAKKKQALRGEVVRLPADMWAEVERVGEVSGLKRSSMARHLIRLALDAKLYQKRPTLDVPAPGEGKR